MHSQHTIGLTCECDYRAPPAPQSQLVCWRELHGHGPAGGDVIRSGLLDVVQLKQRVKHCTDQQAGGRRDGGEQGDVRGQGVGGVAGQYRMRGCPRLE